MKKIYIAAAVLLSAVPAVPAAELSDLGLGEIAKTRVTEVSKPAPVTPPGVTIANYTTDETFTFEDQAKAGLAAREAQLKAAGITTLGGRVVESGNDYSFVIDYLPTVKGNQALPPAVIADTYKNGASYWREADAQAAMKTCAANFKAAKLAVLGSYVFDAGGDNAFAVDYLQKDVLRPAQQYDVKFMTYTGGKFTFESGAEKAVPSYLSLFKTAGVPAIRAKAVARPDGDYAVMVEYPVKTGRGGPRPQYAVNRYDSRETFTFEKDALAASSARLPAFGKAGAAPLSAVVRPEGNDFSFSVDYLVENIYQQGGAIPSIAVQNYQAPETFTFDHEAKKAMEAKAASFNAAGMGVIGSALTGSLGSFSYTLDYIVKAGQGQAAPQHPY